ncbi:MAG TPA: RNase adapter RapZ [Anaeromyxobacteraceae bacterium]|nr:RNase adapter RapZ [Anaeromyxobacteraceae bacterium]
MTARAPAAVPSSSGTQVVILTGVSGSGKTTALRALEDGGFYCIDNFPVVFLEKLVELIGHTAGEVSRLALVVDAREGRFLRDAPRIIEEVRAKGGDVMVLYLDASDESLVRRYSETRRRHPLAGDSGSVPEGIAAERKALAGLKALADEVVDTTNLNVHELKRLAHNRFVGAGAETMGVTLVSFGFRTGVPTHADLVLDVRFLPNPYFVPELKPFPGTDPRVRDWVLAHEDAQRFLEKADDLAGFLIPRYRAEGKTYLTVAVGCTGGRHRSVAIAGELAERLGRRGIPVRVWHRDVEKE